MTTPLRLVRLACQEIGLPEPVVRPAAGSWWAEITCPKDPALVAWALAEWTDNGAPGIRLGCALEHDLDVDGNVLSIRVRPEEAETTREALRRDLIRSLEAEGYVTVGSRGDAA